ncbi:hypothetical protein ACODT3_41055 [Streptomyces sp. 4.24]|uniref:hypothetical protein n=1 Tax=Streptomyces tritrimontium TaxID=3406573 RepID=UPI003BB642DB
MTYSHRDEAMPSDENRHAWSLAAAHKDLDGALGWLITLTTQMQDICRIADIPTGTDECFAQAFRSVIISILRCEVLQERSRAAELKVECGSTSLGPGERWRDFRQG